MFALDQALVEMVRKEQDKVNARKEKQSMSWTWSFSVLLLVV
jgi:hypothetical protein